MNKKEEIDQNGWILVKNVFNTDEINKFREDIQQEKDHTGDLLSSKLLSKIVSDKRIIDTIKECLGSDEIYYYGDSSFSINVVGNGFHKDSRDRGEKNSQEFKDKDYSLLRLGIYLQDHTKHSKGLCLRTASHLSPNLKEGKIENVKSEIGDLVIWKLTTTHSANADVISMIPTISLHPRIARLFPSFMKQKFINPRMAVFMSFGKVDNYASDYIEYLKTRKYAIDRWLSSNYDKEAINEMEKNNVKVYTGFNINEIEQDKISVGHM